MMGLTAKEDKKILMLPAIVTWENMQRIIFIMKTRINSFNITAENRYCVAIHKQEGSDL